MEYIDEHGFTINLLTMQQDSNKQGKNAGKASYVGSEQIVENIIKSVLIIFKVISRALFKKVIGLHSARRSRYSNCLI
jgi:hypothetical protein